MSTSSLVAQKITDQYKAIYCHYDGYPSHLLKVLYKYYSIRACRDKAQLMGQSAKTLLYDKLDALFKKDIRGINEDGTLVADDASSGSLFNKFFNKSELIERARDNGCEYIYIYDDDVWHIVNTNNPLLK